MERVNDCRTKGEKEAMLCYKLGIRNEESWVMYGGGGGGERDMGEW